MARRNDGVPGPVKKKPSMPAGGRPARPVGGTSSGPIPLNFAPMEARTLEELPAGEAWQYEPKWDGFRAIVFRDGEDIRLQSRSGKPLARYFPDVLEAVRGVRARRFVLDAEIVIPVAGRLSFDELLMRVHPAASRVKMLAERHPAMLVVFDLLADERGRALIGATLAARRPALEKFAAKYLTAGGAIRLSPATREIATARRWFASAGGNLDGVIAKRIDLPYRSGERDGMVKVKQRKTVDCVVGGFRYAEKPAKGGRVVGSLLLGLYDREGKLDHVGFTSSFAGELRASVTKEVRARAGGAGFSGKAPGGPSRWSTRRTDEWVAVRPDLVVEVEYDHFTGGRFRHGTRFIRWRPDKKPESCGMEQVERREGATMGLLEMAKGK